MDPMTDDEQLPPEAGMVAGQMGPEAPEPPEGAPADQAEDMAEGEAPPKGAITDEEGGGDGAAIADQVIASLQEHTPPEFKGSVDRLVAAGMKAMFTPKINEMALDEVEKHKEGPVAGVAVAVAALMSQLTMRWKGELPGPALTHASLILLMEAMKFLAEGGVIELTADTIAEASEDLSGYMMQKLGLTPEKVAEAHQVMKAGGAQPPQGGEPPPMPQAPGPAPRGLVGSNMGA